MDSLGDFVKVKEETLEKLETVRKAVQEIEDGVEDNKMKTVLAFLQTRTTFDVDVDKIQLDKKSLIDMMSKFLREGTTKGNKSGGTSKAEYTHISLSYFYGEYHARLENDFDIGFQTSEARFEKDRNTIRLLYKDILKALAVDEMVKHGQKGKIRGDVKEDTEEETKEYFKEETEEESKDMSKIDSRIWRKIGEKSREINKQIFSDKSFDITRLIYIERLMNSLKPIVIQLNEVRSKLLFDFSADLLYQKLEQIENSNKSNTDLHVYKLGTMFIEDEAIALGFEEIAKEKCIFRCNLNYDANKELVTALEKIKEN